MTYQISHNLFTILTRELYKKKILYSCHCGERTRNMSAEGKRETM